MPRESTNDETLSVADAGRDVWDIVVVGAGLSGSIAAREAARLGSRVLLVEKATLPRRKVCGCFLNANAVASLAALDLTSLLVTSGAPAVRGVFVAAGRRQAYLPLPTGAALSRFWLDAHLSREATAAGASLLTRTEAHLVGTDDERCTLRLIRGAEEVEIRSRIVVAADGLAGRLARETQGCTQFINPRSRIGVSAATSHVPEGYEPGTIQMVVGREGYIGSLQVEDGRVEIAAALDPAAMKRWGPGETVRRIFEHSPLPRFEGVGDLSWQGTTPLSCRTTPPAGRRIFFVGDAAGYIEPFTGEGMAWAIASGAAVAATAHEAARHYSADLPRRWIAERERLLRGRMRLCRLVTQSLRYQRLTELNVTLLGHLPFLATPVICWLNRPRPIASGQR
ncbi:MAG: NAD(P)/FAD-dependent oxidoreductase [Planctomycetia bacterium]|nr:NAD(P)/FAD-dependent oxidoreductase [Planctomycetia bacterium]